MVGPRSPDFGYDSNDRAKCPRRIPGAGEKGAIPIAFREFSRLCRTENFPSGLTVTAVSVIFTRLSVYTEPAAKVVKRGNSLVRKAGDEIEIHVAGARQLAVPRKLSRDDLLKGIREMRGLIPADFDSTEKTRMNAGFFDANFLLCLLSNETAKADPLRCNRSATLYEFFSSYERFLCRCDCLHCDQRLPPCWIRPSRGKPVERGWLDFRKPITCCYFGNSSAVYAKPRSYIVLTVASHQHAAHNRGIVRGEGDTT
jgi:hypothetical protein